MVVGGGVAGLAAVQTAKNMGARVMCFDTRPAVEEQVKSLGGEFLKVALKESGDGVGGYAKEMSAEYQAAQRELFEKVVPDCDIVGALHASSRRRRRDSRVFSDGSCARVQ